MIIIVLKYVGLGVHASNQATAAFAAICIDTAICRSNISEHLVDGRQRAANLSLSVLIWFSEHVNVVYN
jgi:hypothetical protein